MKAVIFDLGNVLVHYDGEDTFLGLSELTAVSPEKIFAHARTIEYTFGTGQLNGRDYYRLLQDSFGLRVGYDVFTSTFCRNQQRNEAALHFARHLQARPDVFVGIISNTNQIHAQWLRTHLPELEQFGSVLLSNEVGMLKPEAPIYQLALSQLGVPAGNALFVDDLAENVAGATALGLSGYRHEDWQQTRPFIEKWLKSDSFPHFQLEI